MRSLDILYMPTSTFNTEVSMINNIFGPEVGGTLLTHQNVITIDNQFQLNIVGKSVLIKADNFLYFTYKSSVN